MTRRLRGAMLAALCLAATGGSAARAATHRPLPLGDGHTTTAGPRRGSAFACSRPVAGAAPPSLPWIHGNTWDPARRPTIDGRVVWPGALFSMRSQGSSITFAGNGQPVRAATGEFPPGVGDDAAPFAGLAPAISARDVSGSLPSSLALARHASCLLAGAPVGIAVNGVPILAPFTADGLDASAREVTDSCGGRTDAQGLYAYPAGPRCLGRRATGRGHPRLVGYARDGFRIYSQGGRSLRSANLDACHGHTHLVTVNGRRRRLYHYHLTPDFPYSVGCFRGRPAADWRIGESSVPAEPSTPAEPSMPPSPPPPSTAPHVDATPALYPAFDQSVTDYVVRCQSGTPVQLSVSTAAPVSVDGQAPSSGDHTAVVSIEPGQAFTFTWHAVQGTRKYHVRCLPTGFPKAWRTDRAGTPQAEWYLVTPTGAEVNWVAIFDTNGVPVWWHSGTEYDGIDAKLLPDGNLGWARWFRTGFGVSSADAFEEHRLDGSTVQVMKTVGTPSDFHDFQPMPNGDHLMESYRPRDHVDLSAYGGPTDATVLDAEVQEISPTGTLVWSWNSKDHIPLSDSERWWPTIVGKPSTLPDGRKAYDSVHLNSIEPDGNGIVLSLRHTDAVYRIDRATGDVDWKLGGTATPKSLTFLDDPFGSASFGGQHDARVLGDGTLTLHDNGSNRQRGARALRYRIDPVTHTATLLEQLIDPDWPMSTCCGGAQRVFRIVFPAGVSSYRANPIEPGRLSRAALRAGMDVMNPRP